MKKEIIIIAIIGIVFTCLAPFTLTQCHSGIIFDSDSGAIGDTIGGTTAPVIGILSIVLLCWTLIEQIKFNEKQQEFAADEQFKSTFFNLLQIQRDIVKNVRGKFSYLRTLSDKQSLEVSGVDFFVHAKKQLSLIYAALDCKEFCGYYDSIEAFKQEEMMYNEREILEFSISPELFPYTVEGQEQLKKRKNVKYNYQLKFVDTIYSITPQQHSLYQNLSITEKIIKGYAFLFYRYEWIEYYCKHLYYMLKFIQMNEEKRIVYIGKKINETQREKIYQQFKQYAQFIQAQMSVNELVLLYYDSFMRKEMQELIIHYDLLENLPQQCLIKPEHYCNTKIKLKD